MPPPAFGFKIVVTDPTKVIERRIREALGDVVNLAVRKSMPGIRTNLGALIHTAIQNAPETQELKGGILQAELGPKSDLVDRWIDYVISQLVATIQMTFVPLPTFKGRFAGKLVISIMPKTLVDVLANHVAGTYLTNKGVEITWAKWLLQLGDRIIVREFSVDYSNPQFSRTGLATMTKTAKRGWRVPPAYSGTSNDNMITRALDDYADQVPYIVEKELVRNL